MQSLGFLRIKRIEQVQPDACELELELGGAAHTDSPDLQSLGLRDVRLVPSENGGHWLVSGRGRFAGKVGEAVRLGVPEAIPRNGGSERLRIAFLFAIEWRSRSLLPGGRDHYVVELSQVLPGYASGQVTLRRNARKRALEAVQRKRGSAAHAPGTFRVRLLSMSKEPVEAPGIDGKRGNRAVRIWEL